MKKFLLVQVNGTTAKPIFSGSVGICQKKKTELKRQPQFKNFILQVRTEEGFKKVPILPIKHKLKLRAHEK